MAEEHLFLLWEQQKSCLVEATRRPWKEKGQTRPSSVIMPPEKNQRNIRRNLILLGPFVF